MSSPTQLQHQAGAAAAPPNNRLTGKVVLVTGSTRGIGRAIAHACAAEGARVAICGRDREALRGVSEEIRSLGAECASIRIDLADYDSAIKLADNVQRAFGRIDVLVNNASMLGPRDSIMQFDAAEWEQVMRVNLDSVFWITKEALGKMVPQNSGSIINVSSGVGRKGRARWGAYAVSKFALEGLTQVLADEMKEHNVRVNSVNPGPTRTDMRAKAYPGDDLSKLPAPADITNIFVYLASDASRGVNGQQFEARDWMHRSDF